MNELAGAAAVAGHARAGGRQSTSGSSERRSMIFAVHAPRDQFTA
jgi:hypothetical protein